MKKSTDRQIKEFRKMLGKVVPHDLSFVSDDKLREIFESNFESNLSLAERVLFNKYDEIKRKEYKINGMEESARLFHKHIKGGKPTLLVTDNDNDGSLAQSIMIAGKELKSDFLSGVDVEFSQNINPEKALHGITVEVVEAWARKKGFKKNDEMLIVTADNGIQSKDEIDLIKKTFPNSKIIITDHHLPSDTDTPDVDDRVKIVNPMYKPEGFFKNNELNISGANVFSWFLKNVIREEYPTIEEDEFEVFDNIERHSNAMDFVRSNLFNYPIKSYEIKENSELRALMNINNSVRSFINRDIKESDIEVIKKVNPDFDVTSLMGTVQKVKNLNFLAGKYLTMYQDFNDLPEEAKRRSLSQHFSFSAVNYMLDDFEQEGLNLINKNYIEQLRPIIFHYLSNPNKSDFEAEFFEELKKVFLQLKVCEKEIVEQLREIDLMHVLKNETTTILYPKDFELLKIFDRKLLMKVYNENNNGVFMAITHESPESREGRYVVNGSFRGVDYPANKLMDVINSDFKELSVRLKGHDYAAGAFLTSKKEIRFDTVKRLAEFIDFNVRSEREKLDKSLDDKEHYLFDTTNMELAKDFNKAVRGYLPNLKSIEPIFKLTRNSKFLCKETGKAITVGKMLEKEKYGYAVLEMNFGGDALILPVEVVRALQENNFEDFVSLKQIDDGAFMANSVVSRDSINPEKVIEVESKASQEEEVIMDAYRELRKQGFVGKITREKMLEMDLFKRNTAYGEEEFDRVEELIIAMIDKMNVDKQVVLDVEANGLGRPEIFNIGTFDMKIKEGSGIRVPLSEYKKVEYDDEEYRKFSEKYLNGQRIKNVKFDQTTNEIIVNREIEFEMFALVLKSDDFSILSPIEQLVGMTQKNIDKEGMYVTEGDKLITERYAGQDVALIAHNAPYDMGVIRANMPRFLDYVKEHAIVCDTAPLSKTNTLGYADMNIASISVFPDALFYNNPHSDFSLENLVNSPDDFTFPDIRGEYVLKRRGKEYFMVDKKNNIEQELPIDEEYFFDKSNIEEKPIPKNRVKFGVQFLLKNASIRNMLLDQISTQKVTIPETPDYLKNVGADKFFRDFCKKYNFGGDLNKNLINYSEHLKQKDPNEYASFVKFIFGNEHTMENFSADPEAFEKSIKEVEKKKQKEIDKVTKALNDDKITKNAADKKIEKINEKYKDKIVDLDNMSLFADGVNEFFEANKDIYLKYTNNWEYQLLLEVYDPMKSVISKSDRERVSYLTSLPEDRIERMVKEIYDYKKKIGIQGEPFYIRELHNNIDERGDMVIEHFAVLNALTSKYFNRYSNVMSSAPIKILDQAYKESDTAFSRSERFYLTVANSASTKQLSGYDREEESQDVKDAKNIKEVILKNKFLPATMNVVAEKDYESVGKEGLEEIQADLDFVLTYGMIEQSDDYYILAQDMACFNARDYSFEDDLVVDFRAWVASDFDENYLKSDILDAMDDGVTDVTTEDEYEKILRGMKKTYDYYHKLGVENKTLVGNVLEDLQDQYVESYKNIYDKLGYFYVSRVKDDVKKCIDSIHANIVANTDAFNFNVKTVTDETKSKLRDMALEMVSYFSKKHGYDYGHDKVERLAQEIEKIRTIDESLLEIQQDAKNKMKSDDVTFKDISTISPYMILQTKKKDRNKAILNYPELKNRAVSLVRKEGLASKQKLTDEINRDAKNSRTGPKK